MNWIFAAALLLVPAVANAGRLSLNEKVIVHMFEWRWADIASECEEFLGPYGFGGIQISPPNENLIVTEQGPRPWWERYQPISYQLITRSGTEDELKDMLQRCNNVGVRVFADVVFNHMTGDWSTCVGTAGSTCSMGSLQYPIYSYNDFHTPECDVDNYNDATNVKNCKLSGLHDLNQSTDYVRSEIIGYLNKLISYGMAGFRVDAAKHMWPSDLSVIYGSLSDLNTDFGFDSGTQALIYQEVMDMTGSEAVHYYDYTSFGLVTDFRFGNELGRCFQGNNPLHWLYNFGTEWNLLPEDESIVFIENHDTERGDNSNILNYKSHQEYKVGCKTDVKGTEKLMDGSIWPSDARTWSVRNALYSPNLAPSVYHLFPHMKNWLAMQRFDDKAELWERVNEWLKSQMAIAFMLAWGYSQPKILSSFDYTEYAQSPPHDSDYNTLSPRPITNNECSNGWNCQHRWRQIYNMVVFHNVVSGESVSNWWSNNNNQIAFSRGNKGFIAFNLETSDSFSEYIQTGLPEGTYCDVISGNLENGACTGKSFTVNSSGYAQINIDTFSTSSNEDDGVVALHIEAKL